MKILVHRKDNIGDAVLTLPTLEYIERHWPEAQLFFLGPHYTKDIFGHFDSRFNFYFYRKTKHCRGALEKLISLIGKALILWRLRREKINLLFFLGDGVGGYARQLQLIINPHKFVSFCVAPELEQLSLNSKRLLVHLDSSSSEPEFLRNLSILKPFSSVMAILHPKYLNTSVAHKKRLKNSIGMKDTLIVGIHLSARRVLQQWPLKNYQQVINSVLRELSEASIVVTWAPGDSKDPKHPGDDEASCHLKGLVQNEGRLFFKETKTLTELIDVQSLCDIYVCPDGGAMHTAAACGAMLVGMFGDSDCDRWKPLGFGHSIIVASDRCVASISPGEVILKIKALAKNADRKPNTSSAI